jgi:hypothetical protein
MAEVVRSVKAPAASRYHRTPGGICGVAEFEADPVADFHAGVRPRARPETGAVDVAHLHVFDQAPAGGGFSWSFDIEDPGLINGSRGVRVTDLAQFAYGSGTFGGGASLDNSGINFFDPVMNLRLDQSWGYAAISGAFHRNTGGYYNNALNSSNLTLLNTTVQGHPGDTWGWATSAGFLLTDFLGTRGRKQPQGARAAQSRLWLRASRQRGGQAEGQAHRQRAEDHSRRAVQRPQGPQCHAVTGDARPVAPM